MFHLEHAATQPSEGPGLRSSPSVRGVMVRVDPIGAPAQATPQGAAIGRGDILAARDRIAGRVRRTPCLDLEPHAFGVDGCLSLKLELLQHTGSFKPRGAFNRMLSAEVGEPGVIAASGGNFGLAVAYAARELGHRAEVFVPSTSPAVKADRIRALGADVHVVPGYFDEAQDASELRAAESGAFHLHPFDQPEVVAGQGTIGIELESQIPEADTVLVAVGGGGLIAGVASWYGGAARIVGVEPFACPTLHAALEARRPVDVQVGGRAGDSLGPRRIGDIAFDVCLRYAVDVVQVHDDDILQAQRALWREARVVAEPGRATSLAALLSGCYRPKPGERVVALVCGGNADLGFLSDA